MIKASVSEAKQKLSHLLQAVRRGESVLITHRGKTFAKIESIDSAGQQEQIASLIERGVLLPPKGEIDIEAFLAEPLPLMPPEGQLVDAVVAEREEGA